jgi:membrane peptidoglycan carboxypeptidase
VVARNEDPGFLARAWERRRQRRARTKARVQAMSTKRRVARRIGILGTWFLGFVAMVMVAGVVAYFKFTNVPRPEDIPLAQVAKIEYSDGTTMAQVGTVDRTIVSLDKVPETVRWAVLAAEDRSFYSDSAVSIKGTVRAALSDVTGGDTQGGSGITQQYVKNAYLSDSRTLSRKIKELMIAIKLSRNYSKDQILEFYLNTVYFGRNAYGIAAAARAFFNEDVTQLTTAQGALLAALLRAPGYYDPAANPTAAKDRWRYVLDGMVTTHHLSAAQEAAMPFPKVRKPSSTGLSTSGWKWLLINRVFAELQAHGIDEDEVYAKGLVIRTTINRKAQQAAVDAIDTTFADLTAKQKNLKNALVAVNPNNGAVLAYYGGSGPGVKGYDGKTDYNDYAGLGTRPPGSSFKPYTLATALTNTLTGSNDSPRYAINSYITGAQCVHVEGTKICNDPSDAPYSKSKVTIKYAMLHSLNTSFDVLASEVGPNNVAAMAHAAGIRAKDANGNPTLAEQDGTTTFGIGIGDYAVSPLDQADGYATFANDGRTNAAFFVQRATSSDGTTVYQHSKHETQAMDAKVANDVTMTLEPIAGSSGVGLANGRPSAAKTGTEGIGATSPNNSDAWMVGFTPQVSTAVWVGTGFTKPIYNSAGGSEYGRDLPGRTWKAFMDSYLAGAAQEPLPSRQQIQPGRGVPSQQSASPSPSNSSSSSSDSSSPSSSSSSSGSSSPPSSRSSAPSSSSSPAPSSSSSGSSSSSAPPSSASSSPSPACGQLLEPACPP